MQGAYVSKRVLVGRLAMGSDLLGGLMEVVKGNGINMGLVWGIGGLECVKFGYYDQIGRAYQEIFLEKRLEVLALVGNISQKEGQPFIHAHVTVGDEKLSYGGHLMEGSKVFAFEYHILELEGPQQNRTFDPETGLFLWA